MKTEEPSFLACFNVACMLRLGIAGIVQTPAIHPISAVINVFSFIIAVAFIIYWIRKR